MKCSEIKKNDYYNFVRIVSLFLLYSDATASHLVIFIFESVAGIKYQTTVDDSCQASTFVQPSYAKVRFTLALYKWPLSRSPSFNNYKFYVLLFTVTQTHFIVLGVQSVEKMLHSTF